MITQKKKILILHNPKLEALIRFEAIVFVKSEAEVKRAWENNKTPIMHAAAISSRIKKKYECIDFCDPFIDCEAFTEFCHSNGIECGEFMSKEKYDTSKEDCFLCTIAGRDGYSTVASYNRNTAKDRDLIIYDSKNFFVKIELGCLTPGMLMICTKSHILSAAQIPKEQVDEYEAVKRDMEFILQGAFKKSPVVFFEHGSAPHGMSSHQRSIVHMHTHLCVGYPFPKKYIDMVKLQPENIENLADKKYLSYQEGTNGEFLAVSDPEVYVQRQYPRQVIGEILGIDNRFTNWRVEPFEENMTETFETLYYFLKTNAEFLSSRIVRATAGFVKGYELRKNK